MFVLTTQEAIGGTSFRKDKEVVKLLEGNGIRFIHPG